MHNSVKILIILLQVQQIFMQFGVPMPPDLQPDEEPLKRVDEFDTVNCYKPASYGRCKGWRKMWYFNKWIKHCLTFTYSNCGGNANRFFTKDECNHKCYLKLKVQPNKKPGLLPEKWIYH